MILSIITINYNNRDGLQKTIDSVLCQTWQDFEWIIIDGGSTDGSKELIEQYQEHFVYWCSEPDKGIYNAMNKGIAKAKGDYLNFMNSGDYYCSDSSLQNVFSRPIPQITGIIYGNYYDVYNSGYREEQLLKDNLDICDLLYRPINHQSTFIRRNLLADIGYDESFYLLADWKAFVQWMISGQEFYHVNTFVACFEMGGIHSLQDNQKQQEITRIRQEVVPYRLLLVCDDLHAIRCESERFPEIKAVINIYGKNNIIRFVLKFCIRLSNYLWRIRHF